MLLSLRSMNQIAMMNMCLYPQKNQFVPTSVLTRTGRIQVNTATASSTNNVNTARHNFHSQAVPTNATRKVNIVKPIVNNVRPKTTFHKSYSPIRRPFNRTTTPRTKFSNQKVNTAEVKAVSAVGGKRESADYPQRALKNKGIVDRGCSKHMTGNMAYLAEYQDYNGGPVAFEGSKGYITGKGKIKTGKLDFEDVCFVKELQHFNLYSVSQMCNKKNKVLFTDTECLVLSPDCLACLIAKATVDESNKWHRRSKGTRGNTVMPEFHNKMELLKERTGSVLVTKPQNKTPYELITGKIPIISYIRPFGCHVTILKTIDHLGPKEANHSVVKSSKAKNEGEKPNKNTNLKTNEKPVDQEDQAFLDELKRLKRQEKRLMMQLKLLERSLPKILRICFFKQELLELAVLTQLILLAHQFVLPVLLGVVADFTNLETIVNVSPIPTSRIHFIHPSTQILEDPKSAVQTRSKVNKSSGAYAFKISKVLEDESWVDPTTVFRDDETIAEFLVSMSQTKAKQKGVEIKDAEDSDRPRATSTRSVLTLKPLPKINPKDKGKKVLEEEAESDADQKGARGLARLNADKILVEKLQKEERDHVGGKKHSNLKTKSFEEIQVLYEKIKRSDDSFNAIGSAKDEKVIKEMNEQAADASKKKVKKDDSVKGEIKEEKGTRKRKLGTRKKMKSKKRKFTSKDDEELRLCLTIAPDEDKEVDL
ncbi:hypothetical protein Tco_0775743 [Tanacetum coccineum]